MILTTIDDLNASKIVNKKTVRVVKLGKPILPKLTNNKQYKGVPYA